MLARYTEAELAAAGPHTLSDELERGRILFFPSAPFSLPSAEDLEFLRAELPKHLDRKNVSFYPRDDRLVGVAGSGVLAHRAARVLRGHANAVQAFLRGRMPEFTQGWVVGTSSFRPLQERGRDLGSHASNELVHVDAGAYGATHGGRVLRFFVNVHPTEDRIWATRGTFPDLWEKHARAAGFSRGAGGLDLSERPWDKARTRALRAIAGLGVERAGMIDGSPYDRAMRRFHNYMKDDAAFRQGKDGYAELVFPPFSAWAVLTDMVSHACLSGQHALVDTFVIPLERCRLAELTPYRVMQQPSGASA
jgi:hypothetical protein